MRSTIGISYNYIALAKPKIRARYSHNVVKNSFHIYTKIEKMETLITIRKTPITIIIILLMISNLRSTFCENLQTDLRPLLLTSPKFSLPKQKKKKKTQISKSDVFNHVF